MTTKDTQSELKNFTPDPDITPEALEEMRCSSYWTASSRHGLACYCAIRSLATWLHVCVLLQQMSGLVLPQ